MQVHLYLDDPDAYAVGSALEGALDDAGPASSIEGVWAAGFKLLREEEAFGHADEAAASSPCWPQRRCALCFAASLLATALSS